MIGRAMTATTFHRHPAAPWVELRESRAAPHCYRLHMHAEYSIGIVDAGAAVFHHAGGPERVEAGSVVLIEPGVWHACNPEDGAPWAYRMLFVQADWLCAQLGVQALRFPARARHDAAAAQTVHRLCQPLDEAGATAFTVTPVCASSSAQERVKLINAAFAAAYAVRWVIPSTVRLEMFTTRPQPLARMFGSSAWVACNAECRLTRITSSNVSRSISPNTCGRTRPTLLTSPSNS